MPGRTNLAEVQEANRQLATLLAAAAATAPVRISSGASMQQYYEPLQVKSFSKRVLHFGLLC